MDDGIRRRNLPGSDSETSEDEGTPRVYENLDVNKSPSEENFTISGILSSILYVSTTSLILYFCYVFYVMKILPQTILGTHSETRNASQTVECSTVYRKQNFVPECTPNFCGRHVIDGLFSPSELHALKFFANEATMVAGGGAGPVSILELHSSTVSYGEEFLSLQKLAANHAPTAEKLQSIYTKKNLEKYDKVRLKIKKAISEKFKIDYDKLLLASPSFFTRISSDEPVTPIDNYVTRHSDTNQFPEFSYSAWLYLNTQNEEFTGGEFIFDSYDEMYETGTLNYEQAVEPKSGRLLIFSSGTENPHHDEIITSGIRLTFTLGFTCDKNAALSDPNLPRFD